METWLTIDNFDRSLLEMGKISNGLIKNSDCFYRQFNKNKTNLRSSICLPMEVKSIFDKAYLYSIFVINGISLVFIVFCYTQIYFSLGYETRRANNHGELTIAKKMALLIFIGW